MKHIFYTTAFYIIAAILIGNQPPGGPCTPNVLAMVLTLLAVGIAIFLIVRDIVLWRKGDKKGVYSLLLHLIVIAFLVMTA